ncbi:MAG: HIT domain-containing protein [Candidatus Adiutrix sp.]|jgi:ATP adenylyltransferase|nr:HIT domain-containing protein [Candidatus Adiutrix sp.]
MEVLWAPWRMAYIKRAGLRDNDCFLCLPPDHIGPDRDRLVLYSDPIVLVMMNLFPYNNGHLLVAPRRHIPSLSAANQAERLALMDQAARSTELLARVMSPQGFNLGVNQGRVAGGSVEDHLHLHVTPRYQGDSNYMTVFGQTRVISEHILAAFDHLAPLFNE